MEGVCKLDKASSGSALSARRASSPVAASASGRPPPRAPSGSLGSASGGAAGQLQWANVFGGAPPPPCRRRACSNTRPAERTTGGRDAADATPTAPTPAGGPSGGTTRIAGVDGVLPRSRRRQLEGTAHRSASVEHMQQLQHRPSRKAILSRPSTSVKQRLELDPSQPDLALPDRRRGSPNARVRRTSSELICSLGGDLSHGLRPAASEADLRKPRSPREERELMRWHTERRDCAGACVGGDVHDIVKSARARADSITPQPDSSATVSTADDEFEREALLAQFCLSRRTQNLVRARLVDPTVAWADVHEESIRAVDRPSARKVSCADSTPSSRRGSATSPRSQTEWRRSNSSAEPVRPFPVDGIGLHQVPMPTVPTDTGAKPSHRSVLGSADSPRVPCALFQASSPSPSSADGNAFATGGNGACGGGTSSLDPCEFKALTAHFCLSQRTTRLLSKGPRGSQSPASTPRQHQPALRESKVAQVSCVDQFSAPPPSANNSTGMWAGDSSDPNLAPLPFADDSAGVGTVLIRTRDQSPAPSMPGTRQYGRCSTSAVGDGHHQRRDHSSVDASVQGFVPTVCRMSTHSSSCVPATIVATTSAAPPCDPGTSSTAAGPATPVVSSGMATVASAADSPAQFRVAWKCTPDDGWRKQSTEKLHLAPTPPRHDFGPLLTRQWSLQEIADELKRLRAPHSIGNLAAATPSKSLSMSRP